MTMPLSPVVFAICMLNVVLMFWLFELGINHWLIALEAIGAGLAIGFFEFWITWRNDKR